MVRRRPPLSHNPTLPLMSTTTTIEPTTETKPSNGDVLDQWPPVQHLIDKKDRPAKPGTIALCGVKLMGMDLGKFDPAKSEVCPKCRKVFEDSLR